MCVCIFVGKHVCVSEKETKRGYIEKSIWDIWSSYGFKNRVFDTGLMLYYLCFDQGHNGYIKKPT